MTGLPSVRYGRDEVAAPPATPGDRWWYTGVTSVLLLIGGVIVPFLGWGVGVALLWRSRTWRVADKIIGTIAPPLGGLMTVNFLRTPVYVTSSTNGYTTGTELLVPEPVLVLMWIAAILPLVTFAYLLVRARILRR